MRETSTGEATPGRHGRGLIWSAVAAVAVVTLAGILIPTFVVQPFGVGQTSLTPTIEAGDWVLIDKLTPRLSGYARGDIVLVKAWSLGWPSGMGLPDRLLRIIGQPGDTVDFDDGIVYVTPPDGHRFREGAAPKPTSMCPDRHWVLEGSFFLLSDHRSATDDFFVCLRPIPRVGIVGRLWL